MYAINPLAVSRYRERHTVARAKSDHADAVVLANILRTDADVHRLLPSDSELVQTIAVLARGGQTLCGTGSRSPISSDPF
jgi:Transposase